MNTAKRRLKSLRKRRPANEYDGELSIEIGTEELPPTALKALSLAFEQGLIEGLKAHNLDFNAANIKRFATPRRLAVLIPELDTQQADQAVEKLGPAVAAAFDKEGRPTKAAMGFAKSNQVAFEQLQQVETEKGLRLAFISTKKGQPTSTLLAAIITSALDGLPFQSECAGELRALNLLDRCIGC